MRCRSCPCGQSLRTIEVVKSHREPELVSVEGSALGSGWMGTKWDPNPRTPSNVPMGLPERRPFLVRFSWAALKLALLASNFQDCPRIRGTNWGTLPFFFFSCFQGHYWRVEFLLLLNIYFCNLNFSREFPLFPEHTTYTLLLLLFFTLPFSALSSGLRRFHCSRCSSSRTIPSLPFFSTSAPLFLGLVSVGVSTRLHFLIRLL